MLAAGTQTFCVLLTPGAPDFQSLSMTRAPFPLVLHYTDFQEKYFSVSVSPSSVMLLCHYVTNNSSIYTYLN